MALLSGTTPAALQELTRARLVAASTTAGSRVTVGRQEPYTTLADLPALDISCSRSSLRMQLDGQSGLCTPVWQASYQVVVAVRASGATDAAADAAMRALAEEVIDATAGSLSYLGDLPGALSGVEVQSYVGPEDAAVGVSGCVVVLTIDVDGVQYG